MPEYYDVWPSHAVWRSVRHGAPRALSRRAQLAGVTVSRENTEPRTIRTVTGVVTRMGCRPPAKLLCQLAENILVAHR